MATRIPEPDNHILLRWYIDLAGDHACGAATHAAATSPLVVAIIYTAASSIK